MAMNLSLSKLPWYAQLGAFVALSLGGGRRLLELLRAARRRQTSTQREAQLATVQRRHRARPRRRRAAAGVPPRGRRSLEAQLDRLRAGAARGDRTSRDLLRRVQAMATQSNLTIRGFTPQAVATQADARRVADRPAARRHLSRPRARSSSGSASSRASSTSTSINIKAQDERTAGATITADCTATTFVLLEPASRRSSGRQPGARDRRRRRSSAVMLEHPAFSRRSPWRSRSSSQLRTCRTHSQRLRRHPQPAPAAAAAGAAPAPTPQAAPAQRPTAPAGRSSSRRDTPTTRTAGAIRSSACCAAVPTRRIRRRGRGRLASRARDERSHAERHCREPGRLRRHPAGRRQQDLHRQAGRQAARRHDSDDYARTAW